jgi:hypothetical protein
MVALAPLAIIAAAMLSLVALYIYEQMFGSPLEGLAKSVPVVGGYIARGVKAAAAYGKAILTRYTIGYIDKLVDWFTGVAQTAEHFVAAVNAYLVELPGYLDHLTHVTVHRIVKLFVDPIRDVAHMAERDATTALHGIDTIERELETKFAGIEGTVKSSIDHATDVLRNVDLPHLHDALERDLHQAANVAAGEIGDVQDFAAGWIDYLLDQLQRLPIEQLLEGAAAGTAAYALAQTIANEAGLSRAECRAKVKGICATDPSAWAKLLAGVVPLFALPALDEIVSTAQLLVGDVLPAVRVLGRIE